MEYWWSSGGFVNISCCILIVLVASKVTVDCILWMRRTLAASNVFLLWSLIIEWLVLLREFFLNCPVNMSGDIAINRFITYNGQCNNTLIVFSILGTDQRKRHGCFSYTIYRPRDKLLLILVSRIIKYFIWHFWLLVWRIISSQCYTDDNPWHDHRTYPDLEIIVQVTFFLASQNKPMVNYGICSEHNVLVSWLCGC